MQPGYKILYTRHYRVPRLLAQRKKGSPIFREHSFRYVKAAKSPLPENGFHWIGFFQPSSRGGATICIVEHTETGRRAYGIARCSFSDPFNYRRGREIAANRAFLKLTPKDSFKRAIAEEKNVQILYYSTNGEEKTPFWREVVPAKINHKTNCIIGECLLRNDIRSFRFDRILDWVVVDRTDDTSGTRQ